ncbi:MAG TPA: hypothetical protein VK821_17380, partial [Dehalococcoidia bacterium]|nr:hypothetical protein [Dehalococcoidia bacterium]
MTTGAPDGTAAPPGAPAAAAEAGATPVTGADAGTPIGATAAGAAPTAGTLGLALVAGAATTAEGTVAWAVAEAVDAAVATAAVEPARLGRGTLIVSPGCPPATLGVKPCADPELLATAGGGGLTGAAAAALAGAGVLVGDAVGVADGVGTLVGVRRTAAAVAVTTAVIGPELVPVSPCWRVSMCATPAPRRSAAIPAAAQPARYHSGRLAPRSRIGAGEIPGAGDASSCSCESEKDRPAGSSGSRLVAEAIVRSS